MRQRLGDLNAFVVDGIQGLREISAFGAGRSRLAETAARGRGFARHRIRFLKHQAVQAGFIESLTALGGMAVLIAGVWLVGEGRMGPDRCASGDPACHVVLCTGDRAGQDPWTAHGDPGRLAPDIRGTRRAGGGPGRPRLDRRRPIAGGHHRPSRSTRSPSPTVTAFDQPFTTSRSRLSPARRWPWWGRSGAGKTTAANMLMRFWDPDSGRIRLGSYDLRDLTLDELRGQIALVSQDTYLFNSTIRENLRMGKQDATDAEIEEAAGLSNAYEFIDAFPDGYETTVGERGMRLSGGQRQRVSIARAILKDAPVLILDEATSHLDAVNEQLVEGGPSPPDERPDHPGDRPSAVHGARRGPHSGAGLGDGWWKRGRTRRCWRRAACTRGLSPRSWWGRRRVRLGRVGQTYRSRGSSKPWTLVDGDLRANPRGPSLLPRWTSTPQGDVLGRGRGPVPHF